MNQKANHETRARWARRLDEISGSGPYADLGGPAIAVLKVLISDYGDERGCNIYPTAGTLANTTHYHIDTVRRARRRLVKVGLLIRGPQTPRGFKYALGRTLMQAPAMGKLRPHLAGNLELRTLSQGTKPYRQEEQEAGCA